MSQFDADALERAAKAARELEKSRNVSAIMEMSKREQAVKKAEEERKKAEAEKGRAGYQNQQERIRWEEQRKTMKQKQQEQMVRAECCVCQKPHAADVLLPIVAALQLVGAGAAKCADSVHVCVLAAVPWCWMLASVCVVTCTQRT